MYQAVIKNFDDWRQKARHFLLKNIPPEQIQFLDKDDGQAVLFFDGVKMDAAPANRKITIPREFMELAVKVACHHDAKRWSLLYTAFWRLQQGEKHLLKISTDPVVHELIMMQKAVSRDAHKAKAFVRFRLCVEDGEEHYIAWHNPDHHIVRLVAPFFQRRFSVMRWSILTPDESVHWDGQQLTYSAGVPASAAPGEDKLEDLWREYYRSTFNPARIKLKMMRSEMPVRHWATLPETNMIPSMLKEAPDRVEKMLGYSEGLSTSAEDFLPPDPTIATLRQAAKTCRGCPLYKCASQTVFSTGPVDARIMLVGEQPGDQEDRTGQPFIGPAGQLLSQALHEAGLKRDEIYLTNAVKHFKFTQNGTQRTHVSPSIREINACKPWLENEIKVLQPKIIVGLGLSAARSLLGHGFAMKEKRGVWHDIENTNIMCTYHPSAALRMPDEAQRAIIYSHLINDLRSVMARLQN